MHRLENIVDNSSKCKKNLSLTALPSFTTKKTFLYVPSLDGLKKKSKLGRVLTRVYLFLWWKIAGPAVHPLQGILPPSLSSNLNCFDSNRSLKKYFQRGGEEENRNSMRGLWKNHALTRKRKLPLGQEGRKKGGHCYWNEIRRSKRWKNCGQNELWLGRKLCNAITGARSSWLAVSVLEHDRPQF